MKRCWIAVLAGSIAAAGCAAGGPPETSEDERVAAHGGPVEADLRRGAGPTEDVDPDLLVRSVPETEAPTEAGGCTTCGPLPDPWTVLGPLPDPWRAPSKP